MGPNPFSNPPFIPPVRLCNFQNTLRSNYFAPPPPSCSHISFLTYKAASLLSFPCNDNGRLSFRFGEVGAYVRTEKGKNLGPNFHPFVQSHFCRVRSPMLPCNFPCCTFLSHFDPSSPLPFCPLSYCRTSGCYATPTTLP
ncbi:hypothetical protein VIN7_6459 [Saccharomyces cerevisiae x Saccharomyces kudriavzevii VIN7]|uniref:Uncharacterized protein n=1 Tax=Saccharomyces cerevisiae x Saccharomyces kudriavzevii (strain VIN7) TaxID=1095631 RepID=H0GT99_SACCK|nr:hypothetical protein VIN7_6459 [Saccharomyces cerevisiae x Saccharomyces kudriavzevii VIN7]